MGLDNLKIQSKSVSSSSSYELISYQSYPTSSYNNSKDLLINSPVRKNGSNVTMRRMVPKSSSTPPIRTETPSVRPIISFPDDICKYLNDELKYFFKNPIDKWRITKAFPWKLFLQFVKLLVVTIHIISIGFEMSSFITKHIAMESTLKSLVFEDWNPDQELNVYPPEQGPYAVYTKANFYNHIDFVIKSLATLTDESFNVFAYDSIGRDHVSPMALHIRQLTTSKLDPFSFDYNINSQEVDRKIPIKLNLKAGDIEWDDFNLQSYLSNHNETLDFNQINEITLVTYLRTIFFHSLTSYYYAPACYKIKVSITYDNTAHSGQIRVSLDTQSYRQPCQGNLSSSKTTIINTYALVTWIVLTISTVSFLLCCRSLKFAWILWTKVTKVARDYYGNKLTVDENWKFFDTGLLIIMINDLIFILASIIKLGDFIRINEDITSANRFSLLYGLGVLLTWCNLLRYLNLFERFNMVTRTIQKAALDIFKFSLVTSIIFTGYSFSGWIVLGPYHLKFATLSQTVECLFSLINADEMFATFASVRIDPGLNGLVIWWFSRIYIYSFVSLFIYFILNLFITIIIEARDSIMNPRSQVHATDHQPFLKKFMSELDNSQEDAIDR